MAIIQEMQQARETLESNGGEVVLDFSSLTRIDPSELKALDELARVADDKSVKVVLSGVNVSVYKVLKLMKLAPRFSFVN